MPEHPTLTLEQLQERERQLDETLGHINEAQCALRPLKCGPDGEIDMASVGARVAVQHLGPAWLVLYDERELVRAEIQRRLDAPRAAGAA